MHISCSPCLRFWIQTGHDIDASHRRSGCYQGGPARTIALDKGARKGFPFVFIMFNVVYWIMHMLPEDNPDSQG